MALGLDAGILLMAIIIASIALVAFVNGILIPEVGSWFLDTLVKMPTFDYRFDGNGEHGNDNFKMYSNLRLISFVIIAIVMTYSAWLYMAEELDLAKKGEANHTLLTSILFMIFILTFPPIWDTIANGMSDLGRYVLSPDNPDEAGEKVSKLMQYVGSIIPPNFDWDSILQGLLNPNDALQGIFRDVFMAVFKAFIAAMLTFLMFVIGTVRIVLTGVLMIALPIILALSLIPFFARVMNGLKDILIGLILAPLLSSLAVSSGLALIDSSSFSPLQEWLASVAVAFLSIFFPVILAPLIGSLVSSATTALTGGIIAGTMLGTGAVIGGIRGSIGAIQGAMAGGYTNPLSLAKAAIGGFGTGLMAGTAKALPSQFSEAITSIPYFGKLGSVVDRASKPISLKAEQIISNIPRIVYEEAASKYAGSLTEGAIPYLTIDTNIPDNQLDSAIVKGQRFSLNIKQLADRGNYIKIADLANSYLQLKHIADKESFGRAFANQVEALSNNAIAMAKLTYGLEQVKQAGGLENYLDQQRINPYDLIHGRDFIRNTVNAKYDLNLPNPEFETSDFAKPDSLELGIVGAYPVKIAFANLIEYARANPIEARESEVEITKRLPTRIDSAVKKILVSHNLSLDKNIRERLTLELGNSINNLEPPVRNTVFEYLQEIDRLPVKLNADTLRHADEILPDIHIQKMARELKSQEDKTNL